MYGIAELNMGRFFETQPNPKFLHPIQPNPRKFLPDPTQPITDIRQFKMFKT